MANRLERRVARLEQVTNIVQNGCIIYFDNAEYETHINEDGNEREVFIGGDFTIDGDTMGIDGLDVHLTEREYQTVVYLPLKRVPAL